MFYRNLTINQDSDSSSFRIILDDSCFTLDTMASRLIEVIITLSRISQSIIFRFSDEVFHQFDTNDLSTTGSTFVYVTHDQMEAMTLATQICLINNGVLQQYEAPLEVYHHPANLFVADFVGNPSINFVEAKGKQAADGSLTLTVLGGLTARFCPAKALELSKWFADRDAAAAKKAADLKEKAAQKGYVEKGNKDEVFRYHIAKVDEEDDSLAELPEITNEDFVLGIRPEFLDIADEGNLRGEIYGAMPTGMESTIKVRVGGFLLTGVVFGSSLFTIGTEVPLSVTGDQIMLFDRKSGQCITSGTLNF